MPPNISVFSFEPQSSAIIFDILSALVACGGMMISETTLLSRIIFPALEKANLPFMLKVSLPSFRSKFEFVFFWSIMSIALILTPDVRYAQYTDDTLKSTVKPFYDNILYR